VRYSEWISSAEEDFVKLSNECDKIYLAGFSMGGLISAILRMILRIRKMII